MKSQNVDFNLHHFRDMQASVFCVYLGNFEVFIVIICRVWCVEYVVPICFNIFPGILFESLISEFSHIFFSSVSLPVYLVHKVWHFCVL